MRLPWLRVERKRVKKLHEERKLTARERLNLLFMRGFQEWNSMFTHVYRFWNGQ